MTSDIINYSSSPRHYQPNYSVKQECSTVTAAPLTTTPVDGRFTVQDLSPPSASSYWTPSSEQLVTCVVGHPSGSTASSLSSFVDDESTSYEDITYNNYGRPSSVAALQAAAAASAVVTNCADYSDGLYHHHHVQHHHQYGSNVVGGGYYESGAGYGDQLHQHQHHHHQHHLGYNDKPPSPPPPYDNNNAADACDMNVTATVGYDDPYVTRLDGQPAQQYHQHVHLQQQQQQQQINDTESDDTERLQQQRRMHCAPDSVGCLQRRTEAALQHPVPVPVVRVVKRRNTANKKERRRTQSINNAFSDLRDCIPNVPSDTKLSKIKTLRLATSYISYLMDVLDSEDPDTDGFKADLSAHTTRRSSTTQQHATAASAAVTAIASRNKSQQQTIGTRLPMDPNNDHHHQQHRENQYHLHKRGKGRTGWPQDVWALELKQEQV